MGASHPKLEAARRRIATIRRKIEVRRQAINKACDDLAGLIRQEAIYEAERKQIIRKIESQRAAKLRVKERQPKNNG